ncbi:porin family protein [Pseudomonas sp. NFXW11]|uniref:outer membrane protein n=1 Tax=Pseudomonas sp. NFXW11 TaxID=2819531 RepID=UPI003CEE7201
MNPVSLRFALLPLLGLGIAHSSLATADDSGLYVSLLGGLNWVQAQDLRQHSTDFVRMNYNQPMTSGYAADLALGWRSPIGLRPELALAYRKNSLDHFSNRIYDGNNKAPGKGQESAGSLMANLWYDLPMPDGFSRIKPYVGGGLGYTRLVIKDLSAAGVSFGPTHRDDVATWQLGAGVAVRLDEHWSASVDYRYLQTRDAHFGDIDGLYPGDVSTRYNAQSLLLGVQYGL